MCWRRPYRRGWVVPRSDQSGKKARCPTLVGRMLRRLRRAVALSRSGGATTVHWSTQRGEEWTFFLISCENRLCNFRLAAAAVKNASFYPNIFSYIFRCHCKRAQKMHTKIFSGFFSDYVFSKWATKVSAIYSVSQSVWVWLSVSLSVWSHVTCVDHELIACE